eukprot:2108150-Pyramimonas_sp.AAC.1
MVATHVCMWANNHGDSAYSRLPPTSSRLVWRPSPGSPTAWTGQRTAKLVHEATQYDPSRDRVP